MCEKNLPKAFCPVLSSPSYVWHLPGSHFFIFAEHCTFNYIYKYKYKVSFIWLNVIQTTEKKYKYRTTAIKIIPYLPCHGTVTLIPDRPIVQDLWQPAWAALYSMRSTTSLGSFLAGISASARSRRMSNPAVTIIKRKIEK